MTDLLDLRDALLQLHLGGVVEADLQTLQDDVLPVQPRADHEWETELLAVAFVHLEKMVPLLWCQVGHARRPLLPGGLCRQLALHGNAPSEVGMASKDTLTT